MKAGKGKRKGNQFERQVCKQLSLWVTRGKKADCFWRSAISGGRATRAMKKGEKVRQAGDICSVSPEGHCLTDAFYVECKHYSDLAISSFLLKGNGPLAKFWAKTCSEARKYNRSPMLIAKQNMFPTLVLVDSVYMMRNSVVSYGTTGGINCEVLLFDDMLRDRPWV